MATKIHILQIGSTDWSKEVQLADNLSWYFFYPDSALAIRKVMKINKLTEFDGIVLDDMNHLPSLFELASMIRPYTLFYNQKENIQDEKAAFFIKRHCAQAVDMADKEKLTAFFSKALYKGQYGDKMKPKDMVVNPRFKGQVTYNGHQNLEFLGKYGDDFKPLLSWRYNLFTSADKPLELWLEYEKDAICELRLKIQKLQQGSIATMIDEEIFSEEDMKQAIVIDGDSAYLSMVLEVKGTGHLKVGSLHLRDSRYHFGKYVLGGRILKDSKRQEINYFFEPGDFKPPLAVYFSGFRQMEGFEGYGMMKSYGMPFLLFSDPRLDGGAFYLASQELEKKITAVIREHLDLLGFNEQELIFSGLSMGTYAAMYYGAEFRPKAIIAGKSLANLGTIAQRERLHSPGIFLPSLDMLKYHTGGNESAEVEELNQRFWRKFRTADFSQTIFAFTYMKEEDYDPTAYRDILNSLYYSNVKLISKGVSGRHTDDLFVTITWFGQYYKYILSQYFGRK